MGVTESKMRVNGYLFPFHRYVIVCVGQDDHIHLTQNTRDQRRPMWFFES
jgi:hypothetical protein